MPRGWQRLGHCVSHWPSGGELARQSQDRISPWCRAGDTGLGVLTSPIHTWNEPEKAQPLHALNLATGTKRGGGSEPQAQDTSLFPMPAPWAGCRGHWGALHPKTGTARPWDCSVHPLHPGTPQPSIQHQGRRKGHRTVPGELAPRATLVRTGQAPAGGASAASQKAAFAGGGVCTGWSPPGPGYGGQGLQLSPPAHPSAQIGAGTAGVPQDSPQHPLSLAPPSQPHPGRDRVGWAPEGSPDCSPHPAKAAPMGDGPAPAPAPAQHPALR